MNLMVPIIADELDGNNDFWAFADSANSMPELCKRQEIELLQLFKSHGDLKAGKKLINANLRHIASAAEKYLDYGIAMDEIIQKGYLGLLKAMKQVNPSDPETFASFVNPYIKGEISRFVARKLADD